MTSTGSNSEFTSSGENNLAALPEKFAAIVRNIGRSYRVRPSNYLPSDHMPTEISEISSQNQSSGNTQNISTIDLTSSASRSIVQNSATNSSNNRKDPIRKLIGKTRNRGTRGKDLRSNQGIPNYLRSCPKRSISDNSKLKYHKRVSENFQKSKENKKTDWKPNDLKCTVCDITVTGFKQLEQHFNNRKHKLNHWKLTPKYCVPCGVFAKFVTPQLWEAHTSSKRHQSKISKLPSKKQVESEYGFTH